MGFNHSGKACRCTGFSRLINATRPGMCLFSGSCCLTSSERGSARTVSCQPGPSLGAPSLAGLANCEGAGLMLKAADHSAHKMPRRGMFPSLMPDCSYKLPGKYRRNYTYLPIHSSVCITRRFDFQQYIKLIMTRVPSVAPSCRRSFAPDNANCRARLGVHVRKDALTLESSFKVG